jgi:uncharacterized membrane protein
MPATASSEDNADLAAHERAAIDALDELHSEHYRRATTAQRVIDTITDRLGRPWAVTILCAVVVLWSGLTLWTTKGGIEHPAFAWLELAATLAALIVAVLILVTQRRADQLDERRAQLTLDLAMLADSRSAKIIELLEEIRRDSPHLADRLDPESKDMATPADPKVVLEALEERDPKSGE